MSTDDEPLPELPDDLRALVSGMQDDPLEADRVARVRQRLGPVLPPAGGGGSAGAGSGMALKLAALGIVLLSSLGAYVATRSASPVATTSPTAPIKTAALSASGVLPAFEPSPVVEADVPSASAPPVTAVPRPPVCAHAAAEQEDVVAEEDILHRARAALATSPRLALDLAEQHARRFPHGVLLQEREIVAIDALDRLGHDREAAARAARFRAHFPASPYMRTLRNRGLVE